MLSAWIHNEEFDDGIEMEAVMQRLETRNNQPGRGLTGGALRSEIWN